MKDRLYLILLGSLLLLAGCHDITVGYLYTDEGKYPLNKMEIYNIPARIEYLQGKLKEFDKQAGSLQAEYDRLNEIYLAKQAVFEEYKNTVVAPARDSIDKILVVGKDDQKIAEIEKRLEEVIRPHQKELQEAADAAQVELKAAETAINQLADRLGMASPVEVKKEIAELQERIEFGIPWSTSVIQGVKGTEPLIYEIEEVTGGSAENAALFRKYVSAAGGGRLYVSMDVDVPAGEYKVSVRVSNEGRTTVFPEAFTFVVTK